MKVIVIGGAMGGSAAALVLAGAGARVTLIERVADPAQAGAGILLQPNGLAVLRALGLGPDLDAFGYRAKRLRVQDSAGRTLLASPIPDFGEGLDHVLAIRRSRLFAALLRAVQAHTGIETRLGIEAIDGDPRGTVTLRDSASGHLETLAADLVIGADGVHSRVRRGGNFGARVRRTGVRYVRGLIDGPVDSDWIGEAWTPLGLFGQAPVDGGLYFFTAAGAPDLARALDRGDLAAFRAAWQRVYPAGSRPLEGVRQFADLLLNEVIRVDCERFVDGRLVLVGDAAHAMAPNLGQGANSALVDVAVLAAEIGRGDDLATALARYDARRRPAVRRVQDLAARLGRLAEDLRRPGLRQVRDAALRLGARLPGLAERNIRDAQQEDPATLGRSVRDVRKIGPPAA